MSKYREDLENYLKTIEVVCNSCLDVGGSANPICNRVKKFEVNDYKILDNNNEKGLHEKWREPDIVADFNIKSWTDITNKFDIHEHFDVIFCLELHEYIEKIEDVFNFVWCKLTEDGTFYFSSNEKYPVHNPIENDYTRNTKKGIEVLLDNCGFKILECIPRRYSPEAFKHIQEAWRIDGLRAARHYEFHDAIGFIYKLKKI